MVSALSGLEGFDQIINAVIADDAFSLFNGQGHVLRQLRRGLLIADCEFDLAQCQFDLCQVAVGVVGRHVLVGAAPGGAAHGIQFGCDIERARRVKAEKVAIGREGSGGAADGMCSPTAVNGIPATGVDVVYNSRPGVQDVRLVARWRRACGLVGPFSNESHAYTSSVNRTLSRAPANRPTWTTRLFSAIVSNCSS